MKRTTLPVVRSRILRRVVVTVGAALLAAVPMVAVGIAPAQAGNTTVTFDNTCDAYGDCDQYYGLPYTESIATFTDGYVTGNLGSAAQYFTTDSDPELGGTIHITFAQPVSNFSVQVTPWAYAAPAITVSADTGQSTSVGPWGWDYPDMRVATLAGPGINAVTIESTGWAYYVIDNVSFDRVLNQPPVALAQDVTVEATGPSGAAASVDNGSYDPDAADAITVVQSPAGPYPLGVTPVTLTVTDSHGASATANATVTVVDTTAPVIAGTPSNQSVTATGSAGAVVTFTEPTASDLVDGAVPVTCTPASGSTFGLGSTTVTCSAIDKAGNAAQSTAFAVNVSFTWSGILQPVNADGSSIFKLGSTVPVKFALTGASAGVTDAIATLSYAKVDNGIEGDVTEAVTNVAATTGNLFRYDPTSGQYIFNWPTKGLTKGTYLLKIGLGDGVTHTVQVSLK